MEFVIGALIPIGVVLGATAVLYGIGYGVLALQRRRNH